MFDSVWVNCPYCDRRIEFQSKAGDCVLADYEISSVPIEVAKDLNGRTEQCLGCEEYVTISAPVGDRVPMFIKR